MSLHSSLDEDFGLLVVERVSSVFPQLNPAAVEERAKSLVTRNKKVCGMQGTSSMLEKDARCGNHFATVDNIDASRPLVGRGH
jgi:hypothetical protein